MATATKDLAKADPNILVADKTPLMPKPVMISVPSRFTLRQAAKHLQATQTDDPARKRIALQVARETSTRHSYLATGPGGLKTVDPDKTTVAEIAVPREIRTPSGIEIVPASGFEIQSYAPVG